mgnify:FL=1
MAIKTKPIHSDITETSSIFGIPVTIEHEVCIMDKQILIATITASITAMISVLAVVIGKYYDKKRELEQQHRTQKIEFYKVFLEKWFDFLDRLSTQSINKEIGEEGRKFITQISWNLILWAGKDVIQEYNKFRKLMFLPINSDNSGLLLILQFENVVFKTLARTTGCVAYSFTFC